MFVCEGERAEGACSTVRLRCSPRDDDGSRAAEMGERGAEDGRLSPSLSFSLLLWCHRAASRSRRVRRHGTRGSARTVCDGTRLRTAVVFWKLRGRPVDARHRHGNSGASFARPFNAERCVPCHVASCSIARMRAFFWCGVRLSPPSSPLASSISWLFSSPRLSLLLCHVAVVTRQARLEHPAARRPPPGRAQTREGNVMESPMRAAEHAPPLRARCARS